ncbi:MAG TPA: transcriptional regulator [Lachnoclostridium sp.]|uniref:Putative transcriptional regulator YheO n=1 Tax=[Clostridium] celerecrescens 18A TaxID=1286362 RepID=A0A2M8Z795_9FIRM|nr:helix-turn-helix transcriptional regulator [Lacrimispora celerecrescens]PJJ29301.1 putative transcriptional regulator YheO [[Clostridium] celerecrescens 18A]HBE87164.1 transcriptional regulator [Lachnoclostridium sp.]
MDTKLELLTQIASGIATHFGNNCEVVIHDIRKEDIESSIVYIENGQVSNRKLGDGPSEIVLETLKKNPDLLKDRLSYLTRTDDGRILKSSTMYIRGINNTIDYILALNYDITGLLTIDNSLKSLLSTSETGDDEKQPKRITHNVNDLLDALIEQSVALVGKPVALMSKDDKVAAIQYLNDAGAFLITRSGDKVSNYFGISKFTLYSYMDTNKEK